VVVVVPAAVIAVPRVVVLRVIGLPLGRTWVAVGVPAVRAFVGGLAQLRLLQAWRVGSVVFMSVVATGVGHRARRRVSARNEPASSGVAGPP
jgi:hypothetical protein